MHTRQHASLKQLAETSEYYNNTDTEQTSLTSVTAKVEKDTWGTSTGKPKPMRWTE